MVMARLSFPIREGRRASCLTDPGDLPRSTVGESALLIGTIVLHLWNRIGGRGIRVACFRLA